MKHPSGRLRVTSVVTVFLFASLGVSPVYATGGTGDEATGHEEPTVEPFTPFTPLDPATFDPEFGPTELEFHAQMASREGVDVDLMTADQADAYRLGALVTQIDLAAPGALLQSRWVSPWELDEAPGGLLTFARDVPPLAADLAIRSGLAVRLVAVDAPLLDESIITVEAMIAELAAMGIDGQIWGEFDLVRLRYVLYSAGQLPTSDQLREVSMVAGGFGVSVERAAPVDATAEYQGGNAISTVTPDCTAGFVVRNGPTFGISTAAHCLHLTGNYHYNGGYFTNGGSLNRLYGDVRWGWSLSGTATKLFRETTASSRVVTGVTSPVIGMGFCQFGKTTLTSCSRVAATNIHVDYSTDAQGRIYRLACSPDHHTANGDSGGPIFGGGIAVGIHSGNVEGRSCFSTVVNLYSGAYVDTYR